MKDFNDMWMFLLPYVLELWSPWDSRGESGLDILKSILWRPWIIQIGGIISQVQLQGVKYDNIDIVMGPLGPSELQQCLWLNTLGSTFIYTIIIHILEQNIGG